MQPDELSSEAQRSITGMAVEEEKAISSFEEAFRRIKEATGVTDIQVWMWTEKDLLYLFCNKCFLWIFLSNHYQCLHIDTFFSRVLRVGGSGALYLTKGDTPTSGEAEGRE